MDKIKILLVVLYKQKINESLTIRSFCEGCHEFHKETLLVIWDNSPINQNIDFEYLHNLNIVFTYEHTPENKSLSCIYNIILNTYSRAEAIYLFDQDSILTTEYFQKMECAFYENPDIGLALPYVMHSNQIVSPGVFQFYKGKYLKFLQRGRVYSKNIIAITSGMAIRPDLIVKNKITFDEYLSLYGIDTKFCLDYAKSFSYLCIIDYQLRHSLSQFEKEEKTIKLMRYSSQMKAMRYITKQKSIISYIFCYLATAIRYYLIKIR
ncbi:hypothetical protein NXW89_25725 [Bacteroides thetaiotaomicron]|nr:hypothetical protein [Bacteroides thetaiotaomicron]